MNADDANAGVFNLQFKPNFWTIGLENAILEANEKRELEKPIYFAQINEKVENWTMQNNYTEAGKTWKDLSKGTTVMWKNGCVPQAQFKIASSTHFFDEYSPIDILDTILTEATDINGDILFDNIENTYRKYLPEGTELIACNYDYYNDLKGNIDSSKIRAIGNDSYVELRATIGKDSKGNLIGEHTVVAKDVSIKQNGFMYFDVSPTSNNDVGRIYSTEPLKENSTSKDAQVTGIRTFKFVQTEDRR